MFFPIIPLLAMAAILGGGGTLYWYHQLPDHKKEEADRLAAKLAFELFEKRLDELLPPEARQVHALVKRHFLN